jgi:hypothetical protein
MFAELFCWATGDAACPSSRPFLVEAIGGWLPSSNADTVAQLTLFDPAAASVLGSAATATTRDLESKHTAPIWSQQLAIGWPTIHAGDALDEHLLYVEVGAGSWWHGTTISGAACLTLGALRSGRRLHTVPLLLAPGGSSAFEEDPQLIESFCKEHLFTPTAAASPSQSLAQVGRSLPCGDAPGAHSVQVYRAAPLPFSVGSVYAGRSKSRTRLVQSPILNIWVILVRG